MCQKSIHASAQRDKQKQIIFGKMLHVDSDNCRMNEPKITSIEKL